MDNSSSLSYVSRARTQGEAIIAVGPTKPAAAAASSKGTSILGEPIAAVRADVGRHSFAFLTHSVQPSIGAVRAANKKKAAVLPLVTATPVAQVSGFVIVSIVSRVASSTGIRQACRG